MATSEAKIEGPRVLLDGTQSEAQHGYQHREDDDRLCEKTEVKKPSNTTRLQDLPTPSEAWWFWYQQEYAPTYDDFRSRYILSKESDALTHDADDEEDKIHENLMDLNLKNDNDDKYFPGPLVRGETDPREVYRYVVKKWRRCILQPSHRDRVGNEMVWSLFALLGRNNGMATGKEMAAMLLHRSKHGPGAAKDCGRGTNDLVDLLIFGKKKEALDLAISRGYWEHAFLLENMIDTSLCGRAISGFISGLDDRDPMKTFYQVQAGVLPSAATSYGDETFGDWRPHLAMTLMNSINSDFQKEVIINMGDTLASKGYVQAAHACYLTIEMEPGKYNQNTRLVLVGGDHRLPFEEFACNTAIEQTELYEYWSSLRDGHCVPYFQMFKILHAGRLFQAGHYAKALKYADAIGKALLASPSADRWVLTNLLKFCAALPPALQGELPWITSLKRLEKNLGLKDVTVPPEGSELFQRQSVVPLENKSDTAHGSGMEVSQPSPAEDISPALLQGQPEVQSVELEEGVSSQSDPTNHSSPMEMNTQNSHLKDVKDGIKEKPDHFSFVPLDNELKTAHGSGMEVSQPSPAEDISPALVQSQPEVQSVELEEGVSSQSDPTNLSFQIFKILYAARLFQAGHSAKALKYAEALGKALLASHSADRWVLSNLLKFCAALPPELQGELPWITSLKRLEKDLGFKDVTVPPEGSELFQHQSVVPLENKSDTAHGSGMEVSQPSPAEDISPALVQGQPEVQSMESEEGVSSQSDPTNRSSPMEMNTQNIHLKEVKEGFKEKPDHFFVITIISERSSCSEQDNSSVCRGNPKIIRPRKKRFWTSWFGCFRRAEE